MEHGMGERQERVGAGGRLPVEEALPELRRVLRTGTNTVLVAPPGAGKTTRVPLALLEEPWAAGGRILMLEPRRLAARSAARYMASRLGEPVGRTVGYRVRMDTCVGPDTRIEVITEGVLTRMLHTDPALEGVAAVLFDEFHERNLHADLGLALCLQAQGLLREELRLVVMSATLEAEPVAALMGDAPVVVSEGRAYPVETRYAERRPEGRLEDAVAPAVLEALRSCEGDVLVFLPGAGEIRRTENRLGEALKGRQVKVLPLHGTLPQEAQDQALAPAPPGWRKVVLATSIAETSLTVDGVRVVVDGGLSRVPRFSPRTGMTRLETVPVSRASADQRRGRAGRQGPGVCFRLWTEQDDRQLPPRTTPELLEADLAPLALDLAAWGAVPEELRWLDAPPAAAMAQARELLTRLGALGADGQITPHGRAMAGLGLHPRLAHMALRAVPLGLTGLACELAAILGERDFLRAPAGAPPNADLRLRVEALRREGAGEAAALGLSADPAALRRIRAEAAHWRRELAALGRSGPGASERAPASAAPGGAPAGEPAACGLLLALAYPDRIGQLRAAGRFTLRNGRGAAVAEGQHLAHAPYIVAAELDDQGADSRVYLGAPVELAQLEQHLADQLETEVQVVWDRAAQAVRARRRVRLGALVLRDQQVHNSDPDRVAAALLEGVAEEGLELLPWSKASRQLLERLRFMHYADPAWPDVSEQALLDTLPEWLGPFVAGMRSKSDLGRLNMAEVLGELLDWNRKRELDQHAPTHLGVPSGSRIPVDYSDPEAPVLSVRLQELFGLTETPRIGRGRVPVVLHLLSPAQRPVQVTRDLANFWRETYFEVKKDLKGRYPKHYWPDNPLEAVPTNRVRPRN
ncbi:ATP-dependent helicase HrpB [Gorillibacterium sp. sgz5001074]|uniref:ATP-dependent helicase HrpB n=1 Tax=Gorillibacterium sp. sgz5001074 TaxID=3446695 RepID=UPI003F6746C4